MNKLIYILVVGTISISLISIPSSIIVAYSSVNSGSNLVQKVDLKKNEYVSRIDSAIQGIGNISKSIHQISQNLTDVKSNVHTALVSLGRAGLQGNQIRTEIYSISNSDIPSQYSTAHTYLLQSIDSMQKSIELLHTSFTDINNLGISHGQLALWLLNAPNMTYISNMRQEDIDKKTQNQVDAARTSLIQAHTNSKIMAQKFSIFLLQSHGDFATLNHIAFRSAVSNMNTVVPKNCWC